MLFKIFFKFRFDIALGVLYRSSHYYYFLQYNYIEIFRWIPFEILSALNSLSWKHVQLFTHFKNIEYSAMENITVEVMNLQNILPVNCGWIYVVLELCSSVLFSLIYCYIRLFYKECSLQLAWNCDHFK